MSIRAYNEPVSPTPETVTFAQKAIHDLDRPEARFALVDRVSGQELPLSDQIHDLLRQLMVDLAQNRAVAIVPLDHELTPNQAADILNVSRTTIVRLIDSGKLPAHLVGTHHRIRLEDLLAHKQAADIAHEKAMQEMVTLGQELGLE